MAAARTHPPCAAFFMYKYRPETLGGPIYPLLPEKRLFSRLIGHKETEPISDTLYQLSVQFWCRWWDSNPHGGSLHTILSRGCLPIPTHRQIDCLPVRKAPRRHQALQHICPVIPTVLLYYNHQDFSRQNLICAGQTKFSRRTMCRAGTAACRSSWIAYTCAASSCSVIPTVISRFHRIKRTWACFSCAGSRRQSPSRSSSPPSPMWCALVFTLI